MVFLNSHSCPKSSKYKKNDCHSPKSVVTEYCKSHQKTSKRQSFPTRADTYKKPTHPRFPSCRNFAPLGPWDCPRATSQASGCKIPAFWKYCDPPIPTPPKTIIPNEPTAAKNPNHQPHHTTPTAPKWVPIWGPFSEFGSPKGPRFFQGPHYIPFQAEECDKSQSSHYLLNVDNLNTCDDKTSLNLYTCTPNEATLFEGVFPHFFSSVFQRN